MFTPQRKGWSLTPRSSDKNGPILSNPRSIRGAVYRKATDVMVSEATPSLPPPPQGLLGQNGGDAGGSAAEAELWKRFREAGMLDEEELQKRDREALAERVAKLEAELYDYQYNMGLLLIEKKEWTSKYKECQEGLTEAKEILKREQSAHMFAISEIEKREDNLRRALAVEKQCVADLDKALREIHMEHTDVKTTSDNKLAEAKALKEKVEEKSLEKEAMMRSATAQLAEINRKSSNIERKLQELAARESLLEREHILLRKEKETNAEDIACQREELSAWEKTLREGQERLVESQSLLNHREGLVNERENSVRKEEKEIEMLRETVEKSNCSMKEREDFIKVRLTALAAREKEIDSQTEDLQKKDQELLAKEEKLNAREMMEVQKLVDEHKSVMDSKIHDFEIELAEKRKTAEEELKSSFADLEKRENVIKLTDEKLLKREKALEDKMKRLDDDKKELDTKAKALKDWEQTMKVKEIDIEEKRKQLMEDNQNLLTLKSEIDAGSKAMEAEKIMLVTERENLKLTEQERAEHLKLQSKLKQEIDECRVLNESLVKQYEELKNEREKFEKEWEALDEKRAALALDMNMVSEEKGKLEKLKSTVEVKLKSEQQVIRDEIQRELDDIRLKKEAFEANMAHDRSGLLEMLQRERADMVREVDLRKHELEIDMQKGLQKLENEYHEKESEFDEQKTIELNRIKSLRDLADLEMQKIKIEQRSFENVKQEYIAQRKRLEQDQHEIQSDIETLRDLSRSLKDQREEFIKERDGFLSQKCKSCGVQVELSVCSMHAIVDPSSVLLPTLADGYLDHLKDDRGKTCDISPESNGSQPGSSGGRMSWLKSCTRKIFNFSPGKIVEDSAKKHAGKAIIGIEMDKSAECAEDRHQGDENGVTGDPGTFDFDKPLNVPIMSNIVAENSVDIPRIEADNSAMAAPNNNDILSLDENREINSSSLLAEEAKGPHTLKQKVQRGGRRGKTKGLKRTHSVQAVVEESKAFLQGTSEMNESWEVKDSILNDDIANSVHTETASLGQKRHFSQTGNANSSIDADSEVQSESISLGGRRKRRQTVAPGTQAPAEKRYNFRKSTIAGTGASASAVSPKIKRGKTKNRLQASANDKANDVLEEEKGTSCGPVDSSRFVREADRDVHMSQRTTIDSIVQIHELSSQKVEGEEYQVANDVEYSGQSLQQMDVDESVSNMVGQEDEAYETEEGEDSDGDEGDESDSEKHNASIGKKLWKFFTS